MDELPIGDALFLLMPLCESLVKEASAQKIEQITLLISRIPEIIVKKTHQNILYPITYHLKSNTFSKDENLKLVNAVLAVILKLRIDDSKLFYEIYHCLRTQICQQKNTMELIEAHEELKEAVMKCLKTLVKQSTISLIESFYTKQHVALISHGIYLCIKIARFEKSSSLRIASIEAVMALLQVHDEADETDVVLRNQIADVVMLFLPGIASGLLEVALGSDIQNHKITVLAIRAWTRVMTLVMQDTPQFEENTQVSELYMSILKTKDSSNTEKMNNILETAKRTPEWYSAVSEKFKLLFTELDTLTKHSHFKVRKELATDLCSLLLNCSRNMKPCFQVLIEVLITLSEDENSQVTKEAREALQKVQDMCMQDKDMKSAVELLEENLYNLLTKMPRIIRTADGALQLVWLNRLAGYLKILGKQRLSQILLSTAHLRKLLLTLVYITELDCSDVSLLEDVISTDFDEMKYHAVSHSWKQFKFLFDTASVDKLYDIFKILGVNGDQKILVESILKTIDELPKFKKELTLMLNKILEVPIADPASKMSIYKQVVEQYTSSDFWNLPIKVSDEVNLQMAQNNIFQCCLLLEGLGIIANVLQDDYQYFLLKTLYLVIERAGSEHSLIRFAGLSTLSKIAKSQKLDATGELLRSNVDYISYHVTLKLRRVERNPGVLNVISVVTNYTTMDFLPLLKDIVDDLLLQSSSNAQKRNAQSFLKVFHAFLMCVKRLKPASSSKDSGEVSKKLRMAEIVKRDFLEYYNAQRDSKLYEQNIEDDDDDDETLEKLNKDDVEMEENYDYNADEKPEKVPYFVSMTKDIMKRCLHFLPSQDLTESSLAMATLKEGAFILKEYENELLTIIHELWHPLVYRFQHSNPLVINQAWQLLCCLAEVSQDFIRSRTLKEILPALSSFLKKSSKESFKKDSASTYKFTQVFKLQKEMLRGLGSIVNNLNLLERQTWDILNITEPYLDCLQNLELQEHCVNMYKEISDYNADIAWIKCVDIWNRHVERVVPENDLNAWYSQAVSSDVKSSYRQNVLSILQHIDDKCTDF